MLKKYDQEVHPAGETLSDCEVVSAFMMAGVPLDKIECFRVCSCSNLRQLIPFVHQQEKDSIKKQINGKQVSVIFYGTTHVLVILLALLMKIGIYSSG